MSDNNFKYELADDGLAYWNAPFIHTKLGLSTIAICYDDVDDVLLKHGQPDLVNEYAAKARQAFANDPSIAKFINICVVEIPVNPATLEQINRMITVSGVVNVLLKKILRELVIS